MSKIIVLADGTQVAVDELNVNLPLNLITLFSRLRVATDTTEISLTQNTRLRNLLITEGEVSGSGTSSTYNENEASTILSVGTSVGLRRFRSRTAGLYIAGNSLLCFLTFNFEGNGQSNVIKRVGYFSANDGIYLRQVNGVLSWVRRSSVSGSVTEEIVDQSSWSDPNNVATVSKFDSNENNGYSFDQTKCHILWIACEWLGVGDVYCGFVNNTIPVLANIFRHPNIQDKPYMQTANLFLNYEIERTASGGSGDSLRAVCATLKSEGAAEKSGFSQVIKLDNPRITSTANTIYVVFGFRLNPNYINARILVNYLDYIVDDNTDTYYEFLLIKNPTFSGADGQSWVSLNNSAIQYKNAFDNTVTVTDWEYLAKASLISNLKNTPNNQSTIFGIVNYLGSSFDNTPEEWYLTVKATSPSVTIQSASIEFWEQI